MNYKLIKLDSGDRCVGYDNFNCKFRNNIGMVITCILTPKQKDKLKIEMSHEQLINIIQNESK